MLRYTRLYNNDLNQSAFADEQLPLEETPLGLCTLPVSSEKISFGQFNTGEVQTKHNAPCKQYVILLQGEIKIEVSDGTTRKFTAGDIILAEDTEGDGHITTISGGIPLTYIKIPL